MFYSQFILAKKGPLGTIWIAAHLERKLRKNQVADTDIGVSVDSILFPDVPIALRLSSHLLLGVVRIYSRKVNYLFHDCSEALLKVKQAFRSTAVDLPPEESTAPYHSITLPETFDLDDFELPDSEFFQGNYVDHHVSTREQITLQDTMDGVVYSTSQFGLDERFGDGDTSQIGLDLDEDLFLAKVTSPRHTADLLDSENVDPQASDVPMTPFVDMDIDEDQNQFGDDKAAEASEVTLADEQIDSNTQYQKKAEDPEVDMIACAQAPSTPGLVEEEIPTNGHVQEGGTCNLQPESECQDSTALVAEENLENLVHQPDLQITDTSNEMESSLFNKKSPEIDVLGMSNGENGSPSANLQVSQVKQQEDSPPTVVAMDPISSDLAGSVSSPTSVLAEQAKPVSPASEGLDRALIASNSTERVETSHDGETSGKPLPRVEGIPESDCVLQKENCEPQVSISVITEGDLHELCSPSHVVPSSTEPLLESISTCELENSEGKACSDPEGTVIPSRVGTDKKLCQHNHMLRACNSLQNQPDLISLGDENLLSAPCLSSRGAEPCSEETLAEALHASETSAVVRDAECQTTDVADTALEAATMEPIPSVDVQANLTKSDECLDTVISEDNHAESLDCPANPDLPAPEILLSAPATVPEVPRDLLVETLDNDALTEREGSVDGSNILSGQKRRVMESTPILPDGNSAKHSGVSRSKRTLDSVPDDDDLLSSILVGRRSSVLKLRPTPPPLEIASSKRPRVTPRVSMAKRKVVLLDDTMVLHGDTIRQQLTNTEDVRRVRRKAPCTRPEIWMIQKHLLEDDIFSEPLFTGMPADIVSLHNGTYDLSEVKFSEDDGEHTPVKSPIMEEISRNTDLSKENNVQGARKPAVVGHEGEAHVPSGTLVQTESQLQPINSIACENQDQTEAPTGIPPVELTNADQLGEVSSMEVDKLDTGVADATAHASTDGVELPVCSGPLSKDNCNESSVSKIESFPMDKVNETETVLQSDEMLDKPVEKDSLIIDTTNCKGDDAITVAEEGLIQVEGVSVEKDGSHIQESDNGGLVDAVPPSIPQENQVNVGESSSIGTAPVPTEDLSENRTDESVDASIPMDKVNPSSENTSVEGSVSAEMAVETDDHAKEGFTTSDMGVAIEDQIMAESVRDDGGNSCTILNSSEQPQRDSLCSLEINGDAENAPLDEREHPGYQEANLDRSMDAEASAPDTAVRDSVDFGNTVDGNDTGFLNFDDDEVAEEEEEENGMPDSEEARFLENSGWSSRTRAVAKYLQTLFDNGSGQPRKTIPVDNLLSGKTRKEASRMFFETLVLKTRDYIHVEQVNPFDNINIKPRVKLMKADF